MKILVTGASGLLGSDVVIELAKSENKIIKNSFSKRPGFVAADITHKDGITKLSSLDWNCIIHTAASKDPDLCEKDKEGTYMLNVIASEELARAAARKKAKFIFISTDYVFAGENPPYKEGDTPNPINCYGRTKAEAERRILSLCHDAIIFRVSILYGISAGIKASALLYSSIKAIKSKTEAIIDDVIIRYPIYTADVAKAINFIIEKKASGVFHFSSDYKTTKYRIAKEIAQIMGLDSSHINPLKTIPSTTAQRPLDSHLDSSKFHSLGAFPIIPFKERISLIKNTFTL